MQILDVDEYGVLLKVYSAYRPPIKQIYAIENAILKQFPFIGVIEWGGNNDKNTIFLSFQNPLNDIEKQLLFKLMIKFDKTK